MNLFVQIKATDRIHQVSLSPNISGFEYQIVGDPTAHVLSLIVEFLESYLQKKEAPLPPFAWENVSDFTKIVLKQLSTIPFGQSRTYGEIAQEIGNPKAPRAIGGACHRNPFPLFIPCHRVLAHNGLGGFALGLPTKKMLLNHEES